MAEAALGGPKLVGIRGQRYKLIATPKGMQFYDLQQDPQENKPLDIASLDAEAARRYAVLRANLPPPYDQAVD